MSSQETIIRPIDATVTDAEWAIQAFQHEAIDKQTYDAALENAFQRANKAGQGDWFLKQIQPFFADGALSGMFAETTGGGRE